MRNWNRKKQITFCATKTQFTGRIVLIVFAADALSYVLHAFHAFTNLRYTRSNALSSAAFWNRYWDPFFRCLLCALLARNSFNKWRLEIFWFLLFTLNLNSHVRDTRDPSRNWNYSLDTFRTPNQIKRGKKSNKKREKRKLSTRQMRTHSILQFLSASILSATGQRYAYELCVAHELRHSSNYSTHWAPVLKWNCVWLLSVSRAHSTQYTTLFKRVPLDCENE